MVLLLLALLGFVAAASVFVWKSTCELAIEDLKELEPAEDEIYRQEFRIVCLDRYSAECVSGWGDSDAYETCLAGDVGLDTQARCRVNTKCPQDGKDVDATWTGQPHEAGSLKACNGVLKVGGC